MANQTTADKKDRSSGGDVSKAVEITVAKTTPTTWDALNSNGPIER